MQSEVCRVARLSLVVAIARGGAIGVNNRLPWHLSDDLRRFKAITMDHPIVMGRRTHESIGRTLPGRRNIVLSRDPGYRAEGCDVYRNLDEALAACANEAEVFVIGGAGLFADALARADRLYLTEIDAEFDADTFFPEWDRRGWHEVLREPHRAPEGYRYDFVIYDKEAR